MRTIIITCALLLAATSATARDGKYLGNNGSQYDPNSVNNPYGRYGSQYSPDSINNPYGKYGSQYSPHSVTNPYATSAPKAISQGGGYQGRVTANPYAAGATQDPESWRSSEQPSELYSDDEE